MVTNRKTPIDPMVSSAAFNRQQQQKPTSHQLPQARALLISTSNKPNTNQETYVESDFTKRYPQSLLDEPSGSGLHFVMVSVISFGAIRVGLAGLGVTTNANVKKYAKSAGHEAGEPSSPLSKKGGGLFLLGGDDDQIRSGNTNPNPNPKLQSPSMLRRFSQTDANKSRRPEFYATHGKLEDLRTVVLLSFLLFHRLGIFDSLLVRAKKGFNTEMMHNDFLVSKAGIPWQRRTFVHNPRLVSASDPAFRTMLL